MWDPCEKNSQCFERKVVSVEVGESQETQRCANDRHDMSLAVKMALNPQCKRTNKTNKQTKYTTGGPLGVQIMRQGFAFSIFLLESTAKLYGFL